MGAVVIQLLLANDLVGAPITCGVFAYGRHTMARKGTRTVGADFDPEHDRLLRDYCELAGIDYATFVRRACYPILDDFKKFRDNAMNIAMGFTKE